VVAGVRQRQLANVEVQVEIGILDPVGVIEPERDLDDAPAKRR
jgi:hypothetical protein